MGVKGTIAPRLAGVHMELGRMEASHKGIKKRNEGVTKSINDGYA